MLNEFFKCLMWIAVVIIGATVVCVPVAFLLAIHEDKIQKILAKIRRKNK